MQWDISIRLTGQFHAMGDPDGLRASAESLQSQTGQLQEEYDALRLAMDTLTGANAVLQNRFSPQLSRRTAEIFQELTEAHCASNLKLLKYFILRA